MLAQIPFGQAHVILVLTGMTLVSSHGSNKKESEYDQEKHNHTLKTGQSLKTSGGQLK